MNGLQTVHWDEAGTCLSIGGISTSTMLGNLLEFLYFGGKLLRTRTRTRKVLRAALLLTTPIAKVISGPSAASHSSSPY